MKLVQVVAHVLGAWCVYAAMVACSATSNVLSQEDEDSGTVELADALASPEREAKADTPVVDDVATEKCDKTIGTLQAAIHNYPGKTVAVLAKVVAIQHATSAVDGFAYTHPPIQLKDGFVAAICNPMNYDSVTFVLPN